MPGEPLDIRAVQKKLIRFTSIGVTVIALVTSLMVALPLRDNFHTNATRDITEEALTKAQLLGQFIDRSRDISHQVAQRLASVPEALVPPKQRTSDAAMDDDVLQFALTVATVEAVVRATPDLEGFLVVSPEGETFLETGWVIDKGLWPEDWAELTETKISGPFRMDNDWFLMVSTPVVASGKTVGTDMMVFTLASLFELMARSDVLGETGAVFLLTDQPGDGGAVSFSGDDKPAPDAKLIREAREMQGDFDPSQAVTVRGMGRDTLIAAAPVKGVPWFIAIEKDHDEVFTDLGDAVIFVIAGVGLLILLGIIGVNAIMRPLTERMRSHSETLETKLQIAMDHMDQGLLMMDRDLNFQLHNRKFEELYGLEEGFLNDGGSLAKTFETICRSGMLGTIEDVEAATAARVEAVKSGCGSTQHRLVNGRVINCFYGDWVDDYMVAIYIDVTEEAQATEQIAKSEAQLREILQTSPLGVTIIDLETNVRLFANLTSRRLIGLSDEDDIANASMIETFVDPSQYGRMQETIKSGGVVVNEEVPRRSVDGTHKWFALTSWRPIIYQDRRCFISWTIDISERKRITEANTRQSTILEATLQNMDQGISLFDGDLNLLASNSRFQKLLDLPSGLVEPGTSLRKILEHSGSRGEFGSKSKTEEHVEKLLSIARVSERRTLEQRTAAGTILEVRYNPIRDGEGIVLTYSDITERKAVELAMARSEERFRNAIQSLQEGFALFDANDRLVVYNQVYADNYAWAADIIKPGLSMEELIRRSVESGLRPEAEGREEAFIQEGVDSHRNVMGPRIRFLDDRWFIINKSRSADGSIAITQTDITSLKQIEGELKLKEEQMRLAMENMPNGLCMINKELEIIAYNDRFRDIWGYTDDVLRETGTIAEAMRFLLDDGRFGDLAEIEDADAFVDARAQGILEGRGSGETELADGRVLSINYGPWSNDYRVGVFSDITEQKQAEEQLRVAKQEADAASSQMRGILQTANEAIISLNEKGRIQTVNPAACDLFQYRERDLLLMDIATLIPDAFTPNDAGYPDFAFACAREESLGRGIETHGAKRDGTQFPAYLSIGELQMPTGFHYTLIVSDMTIQKAAEDQLRRAKQAAEDASAAKSAFLANMSHEIRTPLNAIIGLSRLALKTELNPQQMDYMSKVQRASEALLAIINDVLDFSKIEAGKMEMEHTVFELDNVLSDLSLMMTSRAHEKRLEMSLKIDPDVPLDLVGDPLRLSQVLINILSNAIKFTESGSITTSIKAEHLTEDGVTLHFSILDTGIGMTADQVKHLFSAFNQADVSTTRRFGGTGLGLAISKRLVELMGGTIWAESVYGEGATFHFTATFQRATVLGRKPVSTLPDLRDLKVLVVDDQETARMIFSEMVQSMGFDVTAVDGGEAAVAEVLRANGEGPEAYDLVLMDLDMPDLSGVDAIAAVRAEIKDEASCPEFILISGKDWSAVKEDIKQIGAPKLLEKPINQSTLFDAIMMTFHDQASPEPTPGPVISASSAAERALYGTYVLVVEDNEINQQVARELLESVGVSVAIANNGREAVDLVSRATGGRAIDAVLMDLQMPVMDGYEATLAIREDPLHRDLPIIAMTAHAMTSERERCLAIGMHDHIAKPVDPDLLYRTLAKWISRGRRGRRDGMLKRSVPPTTPLAKQIDLPDTVPGLDVKGALELLRGNEKLLGKLLIDFHRKYAEADSETHSLLQEGDRETAQRLIHTIKGVAGNIRADGLFQAASDLDAHLRGDPNDEFETMMGAFERELKTLIGGLASLAGQNAKVLEEEMDVGDSGPPRDNAPDVLSELMDLLRTNNLAAEEKLPDMLRALNGAYRADSAKIEAFVDDLEYDLALEIAESLQKNLKSAMATPPPEA